VVREPDRNPGVASTEIEPMKNYSSLFAVLMVAFVSTTAMAQDSGRMQAEQQACETDVYTYCNDYIPDHDRIAACLRKHWSQISRECRKIMSSHRRRHRSDIMHGSGSDG
jgi:hypothetical protein